MAAQVDHKSVGVFGAGSGLGRSVARRYARDGYDVVLVARRREPLERLAAELAGATVHVITADLTDTAAVPALAERIRAAVGHLDVLYYGPTPDHGFVPARALTPELVRGYLPLALDSLVALVREFLPAMLDRGDGAVLSGQGASAMRGLPHLSGPGPAQAAQRNYLQSLAGEVAADGVFVGQLFIGAAIENTPFHAEREAARAAGEPVWEMPTADPDHLADLLATMHATRSRSEATFPDGLFADRTSTRAVAEVGAVTIDGPDAGELARFYVDALGATYEGERHGFHYARLPHLAFCFQTVDDFVAPTWGGSAGGPMQMHLELYVDDLDEAHRRLESFGATTPEYQPERPTGLIVMRDPAGHPFCIFERPATAALAAPS